MIRFANTYLLHAFNVVVILTCFSYGLTNFMEYSESIVVTNEFYEVILSLGTIIIATGVSIYWFIFGVYISCKINKWRKLDVK